MPSRTFLSLHVPARECCITTAEEPFQPARPLEWYITEPVAEEAILSPLRPFERYTSRFSRSKTSSPDVYDGHNEMSTRRSSSSSRPSGHSKRYSWTLSPKPPSSTPTLPLEVRRTVNHRAYCPGSLDAKHLFYDQKVAARFSHLRDSLRLSKGARPGGATDAAGDLQVLRRSRQCCRSDCHGRLVELKEPWDEHVGRAFTRDILSVLEL